MNRKVFHAFSFQLSSIAIFFFCISLCEINCIKIQIMSLVLNLPILFSRDSLCFVYFDVSLSATEKKFKLVEKKNMGSCAATETRHAQRSYITAAQLSVT